MHFLSSVLEEYIKNSSEDEPKILSELTRETYLKVIQPRMLTGHFQGRVLAMLSKIIRPKNILEIGTYTGYSALCLVEGIHPKGELHTIEVNEELHAIQRSYFNKSGFGEQIIQHAGDALEIIPKLNLKFDLVFIDAGKKDYPQFFEAVLNKTKKGAIILSDNVLWTGKVVEPFNPKDKVTQILRDYNKRLKEDKRVETVLLPIRDGLTLCRVL